MGTLLFTFFFDQSNSNIVIFVLAFLGMSLLWRIESVNLVDKVFFPVLDVKVLVLVVVLLWWFYGGSCNMPSQPHCLILVTLVP